MEAHQFLSPVVCYSEIQYHLSHTSINTSLQSHIQVVIIFYMQQKSGLWSPWVALFHTETSQDCLLSKFKGIRDRAQQDVGQIWFMRLYNLFLRRHQCIFMPMNQDSHGQRLQNLQHICSKSIFEAVVHHKLIGYANIEYQVIVVVPCDKVTTHIMSLATY